MIGFGGKLGPDQAANHAFAVNFQEQNPEVDGMAGVLQVRASLAPARAAALRGFSHGHSASPLVDKIVAVAGMRWELGQDEPMRSSRVRSKIESTGETTRNAQRGLLLFPPANGAGSAGWDLQTAVVEEHVFFP